MILYGKIRFLKHENIIKEYFINFTSLYNIEWRESHEQEKAFDMYAKDRLSKLNTQLIRYAFDWEASKEGFGFWEKMNNLWEIAYPPPPPNIYVNKR